MSKRKPATKVNLVSSVCSIDFEALRAQGVKCLLFDIEGTIALWGTSTVTDDVARCIKKSGIKKIGIVTNINHAHAKRVEQVAQQISAGAYHYPESAHQRKPKPYMINACLDELGVRPQETVMIGDKLFDVLAAKNAKLPAMFWVDRLGDADNWFDRNIYRRVEPLLKRLLSS